ncbi:unnamed protein product, partial [Meganyctiphanes norvegica]
MSKPKLLITRSDIPQKALDLLNQKCDVDMWPKSFPIPRDEMLKRIRGKAGVFCLITEKIDRQMLDAAGSSLKVIGTMSVGHDHLSMDEIKKRGIKSDQQSVVLLNATDEVDAPPVLTSSDFLLSRRNSLLPTRWLAGHMSWTPLRILYWSLLSSGLGKLKTIDHDVIRRIVAHWIRFLLNSLGSPKGQ